jgi:hypothetical protein
MGEQAHSSDDWRRDLRITIVWTLVAKALALTALWLLFFRGHG